MNVEDVTKQYIEAINRHDADRIYRLMSDDHVFIESEGTEHGKSVDMRQGWIDYFKMFPDYHIEVSDMLSRDNTVLMVGKASGTYTTDGNLNPENHWEVPIAWKAVIEGEKVKVWQYYVDPQPIADIMEKANTA